MHHVESNTTGDLSSELPRKRLLIIGAGGFGREILAWAGQIPASQRDWIPFGFLDGNSAALDGLEVALSIVGSPESYIPKADDLFVCAIGKPQVRLKVARDLQSRGAKFINLIHPTAVIGANCHLGVGTIFCPLSLVSCNSTLGDFVIVNACSTIGHDTTLGDGVTLSGHCDVTGGVTLGEGVFMGSHATVTPRINVPDNVTIGAGSAVFHKPRAGSTVVGVPARRLPSSPDQK